MDVLYGGLGISELQFLIFLFKILFINTLDPYWTDPDSLEVLDPDPYPTGYNESGSTTLEQH